MAEKKLVHLQKGGILSVSGGPFAVLCVSGSLWLTMDGEARDLVLEAGESHCRPRIQGKLVLEALQEARLLVEETVAKKTSSDFRTWADQSDWWESNPRHKCRPGG